MFGLWSFIFGRIRKNAFFRVREGPLANVGTFGSAVALSNLKGGLTTVAFKKVGILVYLAVYEFLVRINTVMIRNTLLRPRGC